MSFFWFCAGFNAAGALFAATQGRAWLVLGSCLLAVACYAATRMDDDGE